MNTKNVEEKKLPLALTEEENLQQMVKDCDLLFVGAVLSLGKAPRFWSGGSNSYQIARYKIEKILKGKYGASEISVEHVLVYGSKTAQEGESPELSRRLFAANSKLIVSAHRSDAGTWTALNEDYSAVPATEEWLQKIDLALKR